MRSYDGSQDSLERLIGDLIFKLGKAHQQLHDLSRKVAHLEQILNNHSPEQQSQFSAMEFPLKKIKVQ